MNNQRDQKIENKKMRKRREKPFSGIEVSGDVVGAGELQS